MPENASTLLNSYRKPLGMPRSLALAIVALLLLLTIGLRYGTGSGAYLHLVYLPIIFAGFHFHRLGGLITALVAGALLGPALSPAPVADVAGQPLGWLIRLLAFVLAGLLTGQLARSLHERAAELKQTFSGTLHRFAVLVADRDEQVAGHCERIARNAVAVGREMGVAEADLQALHWAGILHDLGKVAIPDRILQKSGPLNDEEFELVKTHCTVGADLVAGAGSGFAEVAAGIRAHHERWDGTGYPAGLEGEAIPLFGRILGVVDVFEALTSERPYRKSVGVAAACELLRREAGGHFDPRVVRTFLDLYDEGRIAVAGVPAAEPGDRLQANDNA